MLLLWSKLTDTSSVWVSLIYTVLKLTTKSEISDAWHGVCKENCFPSIYIKLFLTLISLFLVVFLT